MAIQLKPEELLEIIQTRINSKIGDIFETALVDLTNQMAQIIYNNISEPIEVGEASFQGVAFAGICVPFSPLVQDEPIPPLIAGYDDEGWE